MIETLFRKYRTLLREGGLYCIVGVWNTIFGWGIYALACMWFQVYVNYLILSVFCNILAVTNAFLCYRYIVFKSTGNFFHEYIKCYLVYGGGSLLAMGVLFLLVELCALPPAVANIAASLLVMAASFFGHKFFSFRKK